MGAMSRVVVLTMMTVLVVPAALAAQSCDESLRQCLAGTVLLRPAEDWDFESCHAEYVACVSDAIIAQ